jgi:hypothetical protein
MSTSHTLTLVTPQGVYGIDGAEADEVVTTGLTAMQYAARHLTHRQWSQVLRAERGLDRILHLPVDSPADRR